MVKNSRITRAEDAQHPALVFEAVGEVVRQGQALRFFSVNRSRPATSAS